MVTTWVINSITAVEQDHARHVWPGQGRGAWCPMSHIGACIVVDNDKGDKLYGTPVKERINNMADHDRGEEPAVLYGVSHEVRV